MPGVDLEAIEARWRAARECLYSDSKPSRGVIALDDVPALVARVRELEAALVWALDTLGEPPEFTGSLDEWERAKAALDGCPPPGRRD